MSKESPVDNLQTCEIFIYFKMLNVFRKQNKDYLTLFFTEFGRLLLLD